MPDAPIGLRRLLAVLASLAIVALGLGRGSAALAAPASDVIATVAGGTVGPPTTQPQLPQGVAVQGAKVYTTDLKNHVVRVLDGSTNPPTETVLVGDGNFNSSFGGTPPSNGTPATSAELFNPWGVAVNGAGSLFIIDSAFNAVFEVPAPGTPTTQFGVSGMAAGNIYAVAGTPGFFNGGYGGDCLPPATGCPATSAQLNFPVGVAIGPAGNIVIADTGNQRIREVAASTGDITTVAGNGNAGTAATAEPA